LPFSTTEKKEKKTKDNDELESQIVVVFCNWGIKPINDDEKELVVIFYNSKKMRKTITSREACCYLL
jgi:hypothetical protein